MAGSSFRGEFERRLKDAINLIATSQGEFLLLVDELHMIVGAGGSEGGMDVSNMLKPMLARGELRLIGASTPEEYRQRIEADAALERRFQPVVIDPPSLEDTVEILRGLRERHEVYHGVLIHDSALEAAAHLSDRYVTGRHLPDKAVDLIDEAASRLRIGIDTTPADLDQAARQARRLEIRLLALPPSDGEDETAAQRGQLEADLAALRAGAAERTAQWQAEQQAIAAIHEVKQQLVRGKAQAARCERTGDLAAGGRPGVRAAARPRTAAGRGGQGPRGPSAGQPDAQGRGRRRGDRRRRQRLDRGAGRAADGRRGGQAAPDGRDDAPARGRPGQRGARDRRADPAQPGRPVGRHPADRDVPVRRPDRSRQDGTGPRPGRVPVR